MSSSPDGRKAPPPRLKIQLPLPGQYYPQTGMGYVSTPYGQTPMPMTPVSGQPQMLYANKASEFVFSQFKGIKDLTKSGLSVGEKSAFWLYEKVCVISRVFLMWIIRIGLHWYRYYKFLHRSVPGANDGSRTFSYLLSCFCTVLEARWYLSRSREPTRKWRMVTFEKKGECTRDEIFEKFFCIWSIISNAQLIFYKLYRK